MTKINFGEWLKLSPAEPKIEKNQKKKNGDSDEVEEGLEMHRI